MDLSVLKYLQGLSEEDMLQKSSNLIVNLFSGEYLPIILVRFKVDGEKLSYHSHQTLTQRPRVKPSDLCLIIESSPRELKIHFKGLSFSNWTKFKLHRPIKPTEDLNDNERGLREKTEVKIEKREKVG